jgi:DNA-binding GntR family transcriptional regulator
MEIEYLSKSNVVANGIRALINDGVLLPGTLLRQRDLAEQFRVSPTPVREALNRRFHLTIYTCAGSPLLLSLLNLVWRSFGSTQKVSSSLQESKAQHRDLLDALRKRDTELAGELTRGHIMSAAKHAGPKEPSRPHAADMDGARNKAR